MPATRPIRCLILVQTHVQNVIILHCLMLILINVSLSLMLLTMWMEPTILAWNPSHHQQTLVAQKISLILMGQVVFPATQLIHCLIWVQIHAQNVIILLLLMRILINVSLSLMLLIMWMVPIILVWNLNRHQQTLVAQKISLILMGRTALTATKLIHTLI